MIRCPSCREEQSDTARFCSLCGAPLPSFSEVVTTPEFPSAQQTQRLNKTGPFGTSTTRVGGGFAPGELLADRYRIISLVGRGGMGAVYRADDLKLGVSVALKFLSGEFSRNPHARERFHSEVRLARQISHPSICRVYDIGEHDGRLFLTMEYVDGEDLASLLRRIGRFGNEKGIEIAHQLCAGLVEAHENGILHRDLKPSNVMLDGRGRVRITDFGLASGPDDVSRGDQPAGTPAYMAPEQRAGAEPSIATEIYALGLLLYEIFTGKRAFDAASLNQLTKQSPIAPSALARDIDPAVERTILACLRREVAARPRSVLEVEAALPGGDPLKVILARGETPSPALVAAARGGSTLGPRTALACLVLFLAGLAASASRLGDFRVFRVGAPQKAPEVLVETAREILARCPDTGPAVGRVWGFFTYWDSMKDAVRRDPSPDWWKRIAALRPGPVMFWYRQSPLPLVPRTRTVGYFDQIPPLPGAADVVLDGKGRLVTFRIVPREATADGGAEPDWRALFSAAGLEFGGFKPVSPTLVPPFGFDVRREWEGFFPEQPGPPVTISAAALAGKPIYFAVKPRWVPQAAASSASENVASFGHLVTLAATILFLIGAALLARRNLKLKRGDRQSALLIAGIVFAVRMAAWLAKTDYVSNLDAQWELAVQAAAQALFWATALWTSYVALEPLVRSRWPHALVSWVRVLEGRFRDPLVGRDVLIGALAGTALHLLLRVEYVAPRWFGLPPGVPSSRGIDALEGNRNVLSAFFDAQHTALELAVGGIFLFLLFRIVLRRDSLATGALLLTAAVVATFPGPSFAISAGTALLRGAVWTFLLVRLGLLAYGVSVLFWYELLTVPLTLDLRVWYAGASILVLFVLAGLGAYSFRSALAGRALFSRLGIE